MKKTYLWKSNKGSIPIELMDDEHLQNAYARCWEVVIAHDVMDKLKKHNKPNFSMGGSTFTPLTQSPLTYEQALIWIQRFIDEAIFRGLKLPEVNRNNIEQRVKTKKAKKEKRIAANERFDDKFK
jgi:hypothetical protein